VESPEQKSGAAFATPLRCNEQSPESVSQESTVSQAQVKSDFLNPAKLRAAYHMPVLTSSLPAAGSGEAAKENGGTKRLVSIGSANGAAILVPTIAAESIIEKIRSGSYKERTEKYRDAFEKALTLHGDYKKAKKDTANFKKTLQAAIWSGECRNSRAVENMVSHSGLLCADLDQLDARLSEVREKLVTDKHVWAVFTSPTGDGLKVLFRVLADLERHYGSFLAVQKYVKELCGVEIDESCSDPSRLCFLPSDPGAYFNPNAIELEPLPEREKTEKPKRESTNADMTVRERIASELLGELAWNEDKGGHACHCPGEYLHTNPTPNEPVKQTHCFAYITDPTRPPTIHCMHNSCKEVVAEKNHELRSEIGRAEGTIFPRNDSERAVRFAQKFGSDLRHVAVWDSWFKWDATRWKRDNNGSVTRLGQTMSQIFLKEAVKIKSSDPENSYGKAAVKAALQSGEASEIRAMLSMACVQPEIAACPDMFDSDPFLFCVRNGVVDLRTGNFLDPRKDYHCTKQAGVAFDKDARCPLWDTHLRAVFAGDETLVKFFQCAVGYSLTGDTREHKLFFLYGRGSNGKSTTMETIQALLGDYARKAPDSLFMLDNHQREPQQEIAELMGKRFVIGSEIEEGGKLAESRVKDMTGGDTLTGRFLYSRSFNFAPTHKLWIFGNHKPDVINNDEGIWRRMCLIPFTVEFKNGQKDPQLKTKLLGELSGILNWAIEGCALWQRTGLQIPQTVNAATDVYRKQEDVLGEFIQEQCEMGAGFREAKRSLHEQYRYWASQAGIKFPLKPKQFSKQIEARPGIGEEKDGIMYWTGIQLKSQESTPAELAEAENVLDFAKETAIQRAAKRVV